MTKTKTTKPKPIFLLEMPTHDIQQHDAIKKFFKNLSVRLKEDYHVVAIPNNTLKSIKCSILSVDPTTETTIQNLDMEDWLSIKN